MDSVKARRYNSIGMVAGIVVLFTMKVVGAVDSLFLPCISLKNYPVNVEFYINGLSSKPDAYGSMHVPAGNTLLEIKKNKVVVYSAQFHVDSGENKTITFNCSEECALLYVVTEPAGALLSMNGNILGSTPYMNRFIKPGSYSIMVTSPGYMPIVRRIDLTMQSEIEFYCMEQTKAIRDSLAMAQKSLYRKQQIRNGALFGITGIGFTVVGAYYDWRAFTYLEKMGEASDAYDRATDNYSERDRQKKIYCLNRAKAREQIFYRNIFYGASGVCLTGFTLSLLF